MDNLLNGEEKRISSSINSSNIQSFLIKSTDFVGDEYGGENSVLFEGYNASSKDPNIKNSTNKIRANIEVFKSVSDSGFAFISAGENVGMKIHFFWEISRPLIISKKDLYYGEKILIPIGLILNVIKLKWNLE